MRELTFNDGYRFGFGFMSAVMSFVIFTTIGFIIGIESKDWF